MPLNSNNHDLWVKKYRYSLQLLELKEKSWKKREGILKLIASWLILAADQRDEILNRELQDLRSAIRNDSDDNQLSALTDKLSTSIARLNKSRNSVTEDGFLADKLAKSLHRLKLTQKLAEEFHESVEKLRSSERVGDKGEVIQAITALLYELISFFTNDNSVITRLEKGETSDHGEIIEDGSSTISLEIHLVLIQLLQALDFPQEIRLQADVIAERMQGGITRAQVGMIIAEIVDLVTQSRLVVQSEKRDMERFLERLSSQLQELDKYIGGAVLLEHETSEHRKKFNDTLDSEMHEIETSLHDSNDLVAIKSAIQIRLDIIQRYLEEDRRIEAERGRHVELRMGHLEAKLKATEEVTSSLREKIKKEHEQAIRDPLTGLFNRIAYDENVQREYNRWVRYKSPFTLIIMDVDHFKRVNDTFGHNAGDRVLISLAHLFLKSIRVTDLLVRFGGEEFVIVASETTEEEAFVLAEKLREKVEKCQFYYEGNEVPITISCGISSIREDDVPEKLFRRADKALYSAKQQGRNQSVVHH